MIDVLCVGILVADVITKPVSEVPAKGLLSRVDSIEMFTGGNAMTAAINISKLGLKSAVMGKVGNDAFGNFLVDTLKEKGIETASVSIDDKVQTSVSVVLSDPCGERTFLHCVGANGTFSIDDVNWDVVEQSKVVFVTGSFLLDTFDGEQTMQFLKRCKEMGKVTALDVCYDSKQRWGEVLNMAMPYIDIFLPSIDEAEKLADCTDVEKIADVFFERGVGSTVIKLGSKGCYVRKEKEAKAVIIPAYKGINAVDTTGAGDSFCSGFLAAYASGEDFVECARFGNATGAHCVMAMGATTGMKSYKEIKEFMATH